MKTFHYIALALTALLLVTSCAIDEMWSDVEPEDEQKVLTFKPKFEDFETVTKAIGDGSKVDKLLVQVYEENGETPVFSKEYSRGDWSKVQIAFYYGKTYTVYFWAYDSNAQFTAYEYKEEDGNILLNKPIKINYPETSLAYNTLESLDAFYSVQTVNLSDNTKKENTVQLTRPFAQVNLGALAKDFTDADVSKAEFTVNDIPSNFTLSDSGVGAVENNETVISPTFTFTEFLFDESEKIVFENEYYRYIGTTYIIVPTWKEKVSVDVAIYGQDANNPIKEATVDLTLATNNRTNLIFKQIAPSWNDSLVDGKEDVPSKPTDGWIHITKPEELAALMIFGAKDSKYRICNNLDLAGMSDDAKERLEKAILDGTAVFTKVTIDASKGSEEGSYTIYNIKGVKALFATASSITIQNLVVDGAIVSGNTHVGVLVNSLSGLNTFTNVTIQNSSATTTSGAAGGMIGYAGRSSETDRSEPLSVTVNNCKINSTTVAGNQAEGKFVGLFSGYDSGETLTIASDCEANTTLTNYSSSPYKSENQSCFLDAPDSKFDEYLGTEKYRRGVINYGDQRIVPKWDGVSAVEPIFIEGNSKNAEIWSSYDLAYFQDKTPTGIVFNTSVDLSAEIFTPIQTLSNLTGNDNTVYNLKINTMQIESSSSMGGGFIRHISGGNINNLTFDGADILVSYDPNGTSGNAYAGTLASTVSGNTTITNVDCLNGKLHAVCKMGGLVGRVSSGKFVCSDCDIFNYHISNDPSPENFLEVFEKEVDVPINKAEAISVLVYSVRNIKAQLHARAEAAFNSAGEVGGLIGFIISSADIDNCTVSNTTIDATGQKDNTDGVKVTGPMSFESKWIIGSWSKKEKNVSMTIDFTIAGRHVNSFIGDIRTCYTTDIVTIDKCHSDNTNIYVSESNSHKYSAGTCTIVGCAYYVGGNIRIAGMDSSKDFGDSKGTVKVDGVTILDTQYADMNLTDLIKLVL